MFSEEPLCVTGIVTALTWPASLLTAASVIDNPWGVCVRRSAEVGKHLAHILLSRQQVTGCSYPGITQGIAPGRWSFVAMLVKWDLSRETKINRTKTQRVLRVTSRYLTHWGKGGGPKWIREILLRFVAFNLKLFSMRRKRSR